jgi:hypothetical protein
MKRAIDVGLFGELADPRVAARLAARAVRIGAMVTPLSRRRVHKVASLHAQETVTLDLLSSGRLIFVDSGRMAGPPR